MAFKEEVVLSLKDEFTAVASKIQGTINGLLGLAGFAGLAISAYSAGEAIKASILKYGAAEQSAAALGFQLKAVGITAESVKDNYIDFATALSRTTMYSKDQVVEVEKLFIQYGLYGDVLKRSVTATLDFAAAKGLDAEQAAKMLTGQSRSIEQLKKYGIVIDENAPRLQKFNSAIDQVSSTFKGTAAALSDTTLGKIDKVSKSFSDLSEAFGKIFAQLESKSGLLKGTAAFFTDLSDAMEVNSSEAGKLSLKILDLSKQRAELQKWEDSPVESFIFGKDTHKEDAAKQISVIDEQLLKLDADLAKFNKKKEEGSKKPLIDPHSVEDSLAQMDRITRGVGSAGSLLSNFASKMQSDMGGAFASISQDFLKNIGDFGAGKVLGAQAGIVGGIIGAAMGVTQVIGGIFDVFASDSRTSFEKITDMISQISASIDAAEARVDDLVAQQQGEASGTRSKGEVAGQSLIDEGLLGAISENNIIRSAQGNVGAVGRSFGDILKDLLDKGHLTWQLSDKNGNFEVINFGKVFVLFSYKLNAWQVVSGFYYFNEEERKAIGQYVMDHAKKNGLSTSAAGVPVGQRPTTDSGTSSTSSNTSGSNYVASSGSGIQTLPGIGTSININIQTIDAQGVQQFVTTQLAPIMRNMSGRNGVVFLNSRGVSGSA